MGKAGASSSGFRFLYTFIPNHIMRIAIVFVVLSIISTSSFAQRRPNVDTLTLGGIKTNMPAGHYAQLSNFDTIFWNPDMKAGMLRKADDAFGHKGEYRVAIQDGRIEQVSFAIGAHNKEEATKYYNGVYKMLTDIYGKPDGTYPAEFRWEGVEQFYAIRMSDDEKGVNVVLSKFEGH